MRRILLAAVVGSILPGCAGLNVAGLVQPPRFEQAPDQPAELRVVAPSSSQPLGGAGVRLWAKVSNPNSFGVTLRTLTGTLYLEESKAATANFPLGLPLSAGQETVIPIDVSVSFSDLPGLAGVARRVMNRQPVPYRLDGTIGVDARRIAQGLVFGPMTLLRGEASVPTEFHRIGLRIAPSMRPAAAPSAR